MLLRFAPQRRFDNLQTNVFNTFSKCISDGANLNTDKLGRNDAEPGQDIKLAFRILWVIDTLEHHRVWVDSGIVFKVPFRDSDSRVGFEVDSGVGCRV